MTAQQIFNKVADHLLTQGERAYENNHCVYRASDGKRCVVGCLISDNYYRKRMEDGYTFADLLEDGKFTLPKYFTTHKDLLHTLQFVHDGISFTHNEPQLMFWRRELEGVATRFDLEPSPKMKELGVTC